MKQNERIIRNGDYYELETIEEILMQQKVSKKDEIPSSTNIPAPPSNIVTELPPRNQALASYFVPASAIIKSEDFGLEEHQNTLEELLKQPIRDEERLEAEKLLKQIAQIKRDSQLPLNGLPSPQPYKKPGAKDAPKEINILATLNTNKLQQDIKELEGMKFVELSRLEHLVDILLGDIKGEVQPTQPSQLDEKVKAEVEAAYNNLSTLTCLKGLPAILNKIAANEIKYLEMNEWVEKSEQISDLNKDILDEFEHDELALKQLETSFQANVEQVRAAIKKLSQ